jgi:methylthioribose-1-phosphate isomerase
MPLQSIYWEDGKIVIIDQTKLPIKLEYKILKDLRDVAEAIINMRVRGAPLIGVTAALGLALIAFKNKGEPKDKIINELIKASDILKGTRPTAINLFYEIDKTLEIAFNSIEPAKAVIEYAVGLIEKDIRINRKMAEVGQAIIEDGDVILTHCNTGSLATVSIGTALGVIKLAHQLGKKIKVYATETRPKLQGARLTMFELLREGIESYLIADTAVAHTIKTKNVTKVILGADRILRDGTLYNKIGTFQIAIIAKELGRKFFTVAPVSTFDLNSNREEIKIEERGSDEIIYVSNCQVAPKNVKTYNPAFDETPPSYITGIVTEYEVLYPPYKENIEELFKKISSKRGDK